VLLLFLLIIVFGAVFLLRNDISILLHGGSVTVSLPDFQKFDFNSFIDNVKKEVFSPEPLRIFNDQSGADLTRAGIISETNNQRVANGLKTLKENAILNQAAMAKAKDILDKQYFDHISPSGVGPDGLAKRYGYDYIIIGENLILGTFSGDKEAVDDWMNSPGHRANILNVRYTEIGVGVMKGIYENQTVWVGVQEFGLPSSVCPSPSAALKKQIEDMQSQLDAASYGITALRKEIDDMSPKRGSDYENAVKEYNSLINRYNDLTDQVKGLVADYNKQVNQFNICVNAE
ncbi:MAG: CAP domain-containing protein, partial [Candidatus Nealsonbacteria bacterium]|nr:CAP domain-containing protein [Candidatus Nealsonbacteria bacterium]